MIRWHCGCRPPPGRAGPRRPSSCHPSPRWAARAPRGWTRTRGRSTPPSSSEKLCVNMTQNRSQTHLSIPAWLLLDLELCLDAVAEVSSLVPPVSAGLPEVGAGVREHGLRLRLRRLQLDARRGDRFRDAASLHVSRLICKTKVQLLKVE